MNTNGSATTFDGDRNTGPPALDFQRLFELSPNPYLILDRDLNIVTANRAYLSSVERELSDIVCRWVWEAFPTDPETRSQAIASFKCVKATGTPDAMALLSLDTPRPAFKGRVELPHKNRTGSGFCLTV